VDLLLEALAGVDAVWRLAIVGAGPERERLETLSRRLGLGGRVSFEGDIPSIRMPAFYRELDVLVLPSRSQPNWVEQFGRVLPEAMACGVPVVGSDCGEIPRVIADAGLIFSEGDARVLRECLIRLVRDAELWDSLARRGRERVLAHFTQAQIAAQTVAVYREMFAGQRHNTDT
jgi:glycosyltransferase involved in cell wall biosynthesis